MNHRKFVGGLWEVIGREQFNWLVGQGLRPHHYLLDAGCGALRAGIHFIPYLEPGHYWGLEKRAALVRAGIEQELDPAVYEAKKPCFAINADFDLAEVPTEIRFDYILAASLFTHLLPDDIERCVAALLPRLAEAGHFYATYLPLDYPGWPQQMIDQRELNIAYLNLEWFGNMLSGLSAKYRLLDYSRARAQKMLRIERN